MPITLHEYQHPPETVGSVWTVSNIDLLAEYVAHLLLGRYLHLASVLAGEADEVPLSPAKLVPHVKARLEDVPDEPRRYHRDGWIFQHISWIAAQISAEGRLAITTPHMQSASKGFDAVILPLPAAGAEPSPVVICEDKATENPRNTIRDAVWPDFEKCEHGERDMELVSEVSALLERFRPEQAKELLEAYLWKNERRYRVAITAAGAPDDAAARKRLFRRYNNVVTGDIARRKSEVVYWDDLRAWMDDFCLRVCTKLDQIAEAKNV